MKMFDTTSSVFQNNPIYFTNSFLCMRKIDPFHFSGILQKPQHSRPFVKKWGSNYVNRVKKSKKNNAILNFLHFKGLKAPNKW